MIAKLARSAVALWADTQGLILPYVTMMLVVIVGLSVLALDGARIMSLQTQLQNGADALALAGAAELDRMPDAETRAVTAVNNLVANSVRFAGSNGAVRASRIEFYSQLPAADSSPITDGVVASDPMTARFISVSVEPVRFATILPASLFGGTNAIAVRASSIAGFDQVVCDMVPLFICNPFEVAGMSEEQGAASLQHAVADPTLRRRLISLRRNENKPYRPGDYGFLDSPLIGSDPGAMIDAVARAHSGVCFRHGTIAIRRGVAGAVRDAFNVRFDLYAGAMVAERNDSNYRPAENVRKGFVGGGAGAGGNQCTAQPANNWPIGRPPNQATGLPLDRRWPNMDGGMGNGDWDFETYWQVNHGSAGRPSPTIDGNLVDNDSLVSRYDIYRYEIEQGYVDDRSPGGETGAPACYAGGALSAAPDRRVIEAAIVNCLSSNIDEQSSAIRVVAFGKFFMTLPIPRGGSDMYVETVGLVAARDGTRNFEIVQLYR
jgi:hypothetical protein